MSGQYGSMDRYLAMNKGTMPTPQQVATLATDGKYSDMHKAMAAAYKEKLAGIDPKTGKVVPNDPLTIYTTFGRPEGDISIAPWAVSEYGYTLPNNVIATNKDKQGNTINFLSKPNTVLNQTDVSTKKSNVREREVEKPYNSPLQALRYIPAVGAGIGVFSDLMGFTNTPDYSNANAVLEASKGIGEINPTPIGDYMSYNPLDREFYINQLNATSSANRRGVINTSGGNRGQAMAGILASDYGAQNQLGMLARQAEEYNLGQRAKVTEFNRGTNMFNSENDFKAQLYSNQNAQLRMNSAAQAASLRDAVDARIGASKSANLTNLFQSLGDIGWETVNRDMVNNNRAFYYNTKSEYKGNSRANGGYLTIKKKKKK